MPCGFALPLSIKAIERHEIIRAGIRRNRGDLSVGDGDIPLRRIIGQVLDAGYEGVFDLELVGPAIESEGYRSALARSCAQLSDLLSEAE